MLKIYLLHLSIGQLDIAVSVVVAEIIFVAVRHCGAPEEGSAGDAGLSSVVRVVAVTGQSCLHYTLDDDAFYILKLKKY